MYQWKKVGNISADTARVIIADPHIILARSGESQKREKEHGLDHTPLTEDEMDRQYKSSSVYTVKAPHFDANREEHWPEAGVVFRTGGDGTYPVVVQVDKDGAPLAAMIIFSPEAVLPASLGKFKPEAKKF